MISRTVSNFDALFRRINAKDKQILATEIREQGDLPVVDQGQAHIAGYTNNLSKRFTPPPGGVIVFGDHTRTEKFVDFDFAIGADGTQLLAARGENDTRFLAFLLAAQEIPNTGYNRHFKFLKELTLSGLPLPEQQAIAAALSDADGVVAGLERVIAKKRLIKQGAMQDLLTARRRLPGFSGEWEVKPFAQIARIRNAKVQTLGNPIAENCIELEQVESETGRILYWSDATNRATVKYQFEAGDVLFGRLRPYLRKFHRANIQGVCSTEIWPLMTQGIDGGFLYQVIQSDGFITAACEAYGTHMPRADWGKIATHQIQVPVDRRE
jgi:hypothetical protein